MNRHKHSVFSSILPAVLLVSMVLSLAGCSRTAETVPSESESESEPDAGEQLDLGIRYLNEGNYQEAILAFTAVIEIEPNNAAVYAYRGRAYLGLGSTEDSLTDARSDFEKALDLDSTLVDAWNGLADVFIARKDYDGARQVFQEALSATGQSEDVLARMEEFDGNGAWRQAYIQYIDSDFVPQYGMDTCEFSLVCIDDDPVPELIIQYHTEGYGWKGNVQICSFDGSRVQTQTFSEVVNFDTYVLEYQNRILLHYAEHDWSDLESTAYINRDQIYELQDGLPVPAAAGEYLSEDVSAGETGNGDAFTFDGAAMSREEYDRTMNEAFPLSEAMHLDPETAAGPDSTLCMEYEAAMTQLRQLEEKDLAMLTPEDLMGLTVDQLAELLGSDYVTTPGDGEYGSISYEDGRVPMQFGYMVNAAGQEYIDSIEYAPSADSPLEELAPGIPARAGHDELTSMLSSDPDFHAEERYCSLLSDNYKYEWYWDEGDSLSEPASRIIIFDMSSGEF